MKFKGEKIRFSNEHTLRFLTGKFSKIHKKKEFVTKLDSEKLKCKVYDKILISYFKIEL
jgi:hypothetical protein